MDTKPKAPLMRELPRKRLSFALAACINTGIAYFRLLMIKLSKQTWKACATAKLYGAAFTCLITWAVHL